MLCNSFSSDWYVCLGFDGVLLPKSTILIFKRMEPQQKSLHCGYPTNLYLLNLYCSFECPTQRFVQNGVAYYAVQHGYHSYHGTHHSLWIDRMTIVWVMVSMIASETHLNSKWISKIQNYSMEKIYIISDLSGKL